MYNFKLTFIKEATWILPEELIPHLNDGVQVVLQIIRSASIVTRRSKRRVFLTFESRRFVDTKYYDLYAIRTEDNNTKETQGTEIQSPLDIQQDHHLEAQPSRLIIHQQTSILALMMEMSVENSWIQ
jgi:hypothetical protein